MPKILSIKEKGSNTMPMCRHTYPLDQKFTKKLLGYTFMNKSNCLGLFAFYLNLFKDNTFQFSIYNFRSKKFLTLGVFIMVAPF